MLKRAIGLAMAALLVGAAPVPRARPALVLAGNGVSVGSTAVPFGRTTRAVAIQAVTAALGAPVKQGNHGDCATDNIVYYAKFAGEFELSFVRGKLVGWTADAAGPRTARQIGVGATLAQVRRAYPDVEVNASEEASGGLGANFQREDGPNGWLDGTRPASKVIGLYAGATCIVN